MLKQATQHQRLVGRLWPTAGRAELAENVRTALIMVSGGTRLTQPAKRLLRPARQAARGTVDDAHFHAPLADAAVCQAFATTAATLVPTRSRQDD